VRAVVASPVPVVSGVGHETDVTLSDFAADVRAPTPTAAAEMVVLAAQECLALLDAFERRIRQRVGHALDSHAQKLDAIAARLARPTRTLQRQVHGLDMLAQRLRAAVQRHIESRLALLQRQGARLSPAVNLLRARQSMRIESLGARLDALDPSRVLARGYAWLADQSGTPVQSVHQLSAGQSLQAVLADGSAQLTVQDVTHKSLG
jgi:exodeoxyribonuclease VII large subunit